VKKNININNIVVVLFIISMEVSKYNPKKISELSGNENEKITFMNFINSFEKNREEIMKTKNDNKKKTRTKKIKIEDSEENENENEIIEIEDINEDIKKKKNINSSNIIIIGNHGCGKTTFVNTILEHIGVEIRSINMKKFDEINKKNIGEKINKLTKEENIFDSFDMSKKKKVVMVIDDIENISSKVEKKFIEQLVKENDDNWYYPIVLISSLKHSKMMTNIKKNTNIIHLEQPDTSEMGILMTKIVAEKKMKFEQKGIKGTIKMILDYSQYDYKKLINIMYDLYRTYGESPISEKNIIEYFEYSKKKDTDIEIYKYSLDLMTNYSDINECICVYNAEKVIIPLMIHQNYLSNVMMVNNISKEKKFSEIEKISESFSFGDIIENYIYSEQNWDMQSVHCFYNCINPSYKLTKMSKNSLSKAYQNLKMIFPKDLNITSTKNINKNNVIKAGTHMSNMNINDFMHSNSLAKMLLEDKRYEECSKIYKGYNANIDIITSILKIDKINIDKTQNQSQKQLIKKMMK